MHRLGIAERIDELRRAGFLSAADAELLRQGRHVLMPASANHVIENVIGVFGLPFAVAPNFLVNCRDYVVPMAVEEPSIVAGSSFAALLARQTGGIAATCEESLLGGQVHVTGVSDVDGAIAALTAAAPELISLANAVHPRLVERGGGMQDIEARALELPDGETAIAIQLLVDTADAMGANLVNTLCEALSLRLAEICGGEAALRILTNLADRSVIKARVRYALSSLGTRDFDAEAVRDRIVLASDIARADPHRAATHNKGIMNGVDAVAIATGNDWRAIEAGAHAYAAAGGRYRPLSTWSVGGDGDLVGELELPLKVGIVGGTTQSNPAVGLALRLAGVESAIELAQLMAAAGLVQNFAALRALATAGIQAGHMKLHARSVAQAAGVPEERFDEVVEALVKSGEIKQWKAEELLAAGREAPRHEAMGEAAGKVILLGEHAVVYGKRALALPIPRAVAARVSAGVSGSTIVIPEWGVDSHIAPDDPTGIGPAVLLIMRELGIETGNYRVEMHSSLPRAMGLGASAAFAVALVRAFASELALELDDAAVNAIAFKCEELAHGTPSGIDNTLATYSTPLLFRRDGALEIETLDLSELPPVVIACSHTPGLTRDQVARVRERRERHPDRFDAIFREMDGLSRDGADALREHDYGRLGELMNIGQGLLSAIGVSTAELEGMVELARAAGAAGAKLTGSGGGGSIVALCPGTEAPVRDALEAAGYRTIGLHGNRDD
jgi:hydroxymethylglutaryl-CoA reductase